MLIWIHECAIFASCECGAVAWAARFCALTSLSTARAFALPLPKERMATMADVFETACAAGVARAGETPKAAFAAASISSDDIAAASAAFFADRANVVAKNAVSAKGIRAVSRVPEKMRLATTTFDIEVKQGERTDQENSGRCWMFAALNTMRMRVIKRYKLETFELSQAYPLFWDKLEKANWFLENVIDTVAEPLHGRLVSFLLTDPVDDGGQWDMFKALVKKYGVVPKEAMPETACSKSTYEMGMYLTRYLRACAKKLRDAAAAGVSAEDLREQKRAMVANVYNMLVICLGEPPKTFDVRLRAADADEPKPSCMADAADGVIGHAAPQGVDALSVGGAPAKPADDFKLALSGTFTPQQFFEQVVDMNIDDYVSLISAPTADKPLGRTYTVARLGNVVEAGGVRYLNLPPADLKAAAVAQLKDGWPVWFGCDVDQFFIQDAGIMDEASLDTTATFGFDIDEGFDKAAQLDYGESMMTHAMVLEGVNLDAQGAPTLWKVENSWGKDHARNGFDTIADPWFDKYVYQVVVDKKYLTDEQRAALATEPIVLDPWDPMGALAD